MNQQNNGMVVLDGTLRDLPILRAWANSSSVYWVKPSFICDKMFMKVGNSEKSGWTATANGTYHPEYGMFKFYVDGKAFARHCETAYRIVAIDDKGCRTVCGEGVLRVSTPTIKDVNDDVRTCIVKFDDGVCREVIIENDTSGVPSFVILETAVQVDADPKTLYAYDKEKKQYFALLGVTVEGNLTLELSETGTTGKDETFVIDKTSGFYRRMEAVEDDTQVEVLEAGSEIVG